MTSVLTTVQEKEDNKILKISKINKKVKTFHSSNKWLIRVFFYKRLLDCKNTCRNQHSLNQRIHSTIEIGLAK